MSICAERDTPMVSDAVLWFDHAMKFCSDYLCMTVSYKAVLIELMIRQAVIPCEKPASCATAVRFQAFRCALQPHLPRQRISDATSLIYGASRIHK